jgi:hypothetical protein
MVPDAKKAFEQALTKKVRVSRDDKAVLMTRIEIGLEQLLNQFAKGDRYARRDLLDYAEKLGIDFLAPHRQVLEQALKPNYRAILDAALTRRSGADNPAAAERALAPPQLLDDDSAEPAPKAPSPPGPDPDQPPEPPPKPGMNYPKPFNQMTMSEKRAWYPEWWAEQQKKQWTKEQAEAEAKEQKAAPKLDQASLGRGRPPPGGFSVTTNKWS